MTAGLPVLGDVRAAAIHCSYCAKLCRFACPVAEATGLESVTPWGIHRSVAGAASATEAGPSRAGGDPGAAHPGLANAWACTGCRRCGSACLPGLDLPTSVRAARAALSGGGPPPPALQAAAGSPVPAPEALQAGATPGAALVAAPGCAAADDASLGTVLAALGIPYRTPDAVACCGARAADVGWYPEAERRAAGWAQATAGAQEVIVGDPHCVRWLRIDRGDERVRDLGSFLAAAVDRIGARAQSRPSEPVAWHDPCWLARGLGVTDAGRAVVAAAAGAPPLEAEGHHDRGGCTGGGMAYEVADPAGADRLRDQVVEQLVATGAPVTVTACPTAAARLRAGGLAAFDLAPWLAAHLADTMEAPSA